MCFTRKELDVLAADGERRSGAVAVHERREIFFDVESIEYRDSFLILEGWVDLWGIRSPQVRSA